VTPTFDIIVIGGGHAGAEAAWAAARLGARTALVTMSIPAIGRMSCNPAIGGLGKGQIVREVDALGGMMGLAADRAGIQFRLLNRAKGPAVWAPRAQADRDGYPGVVQQMLAVTPNLVVVEGIIDAILTTPAADHPGKTRVTGVALQDGRTLRAEAVVLTTGTFLRGLLHTGPATTVGGRIGEPSADALSVSLRALGLELGRLKTGTPPRVHRDTVDYDACEVQEPDPVPVPFSYLTDGIFQPQVNCWVTYTNPVAHEHIRANLHRAPLYTGQIRSVGPRYCPSIEDKIVRFADKPRHQVFLEPEGYDHERIYCNGISTSLPTDVQEAMVHAIPGLHHARILQYGYAVEYDFVPTHQIRPTLETKRVGGLFLAGQINGTSGYEEAAGQGLVAGINAVQHLRCAEPLLLGRDEAYIGVMIDDLITRPPVEPYRMFTSRAEYRLHLRSDNADTRLTPVSRRLGLVDDARWARFERKASAVARLHALTQTGTFDGVPIRSWLRRPEVGLAQVADALDGTRQGPFGTDDLWELLTTAKYEGYVVRQQREIDRFRRLEGMRIPPETDFAAMAELRTEARERLTRLTPATLGQAARISGISPADITVLWVYLTGRRTARRAG